MVFAALDAYAAGVPLEEAGTSELPTAHAPVSRRIWRRQVDSVLTGVGANLWRFALFTYLPSSNILGIAAATRRELLPLFDVLRSGRPVPLGLVSGLGFPYLARNHQVLAYAADFGQERVRIRIYDPNYPRRDDVVLEVPLDPTRPVTEMTGKRSRTWRGLFVVRYRFRRAGR